MFSKIQSHLQFSYKDFFYYHQEFEHSMQAKTMRSFRIQKKNWWLLFGGMWLLYLALSSSLLWKKFALEDFLYPQLALKNGTMNFESWIETPETIDLNLEIFMFNWTNADQVRNLSVKPHFEEIGPYVFKEKHIRTNITWNSNGTVSFNQIRVFTFIKEKSNGTLDDKITNLNAIATVSRKAIQGHLRF